ncbi:helix-turn-helix domain-containing protein [Micromonospora endolithica]|uniref:Helix-turn-helix domain-containing protein n=1 Tax=Micromonospora endolithica TaxID=230091 RepID=A0A3A9YSX7_9ACTN|nr:helix-turn-helix transcriptional regulator [Micromonospora endolithica]RKN39113.1 helix-turn-helix domain-containing protein [Micromonospora endolithica]TWJ25615.1 helix-turn-helix protein [Micromonospora endolithica]
MATGKDLPDVGAFIRDLRRNAKISLRQLADQAGVSNPYLSQIERGLRKPSAEVLQQLASALRVSTPAMYLRAGLLDDKEGQGVLAAIAVDPELTMAQKQSLTQIYETFRRENARLAEATATTDGPEGSTPPSPGPTAPTTADAPDLANLAATGPTTPQGTPTETVVDAAPTAPAGPTSPTEAVIESVAVSEAGSAPAPTPAKKAADAAEEEKS